MAIYLSNSGFTDFENFTKFNPNPQHENTVNQMIDQILSWTGVLKTLRS
jgi:hypothetical protein